MPFFLLLFFLTNCCLAQATSFPVEIALTFDDFPMGSTTFFEKKERAQVYAEKLAELKVQAAFFCIGEQLVDDVGLECLSLIAKDHLLANHSYHHLHLSESSLATFQEEIGDTEELLKEYPNFRKWFRFPYLDYGDRSGLGGTDRKRCSAFLFLRQAGYQHGYITINTFDWYVDGEIKKAAKEGRKIYWDNLKKAYLSLLDEWINDYHTRWNGALKRKFVHVLLLHQNDLNAIFLSDIVKHIKQKEWAIVSPEDAFGSPIPYLTHFANTKRRIFKGVSSLSKSHIDEVLLANHVFENETEQ